MNINRNALLQSLAKTIADYRQNEVAPITTVHVERWLNQFEIQDQPVILAEMDSIMKRFYFSRVRVKECVRGFLKKLIRDTDDAIKQLPLISFLNIQKTGSSQGAMLDIVDEVLREEYNFTLHMTNTKKSQIYIYMDDCVYTGNRLRYDLTDGAETAGWFSNRAPFGATLLIFTVARHTEGIDYAIKYVRDAAQKKQIKVQNMTALIINNVRDFDNSIEVLWPENLHSDPYITSYVSDLQTPFNLYRFNADSLQEKLFSSLAARRIVEKAFLKKGIQIVKASQNPAPSIRPLGFMKLNSLGFGTFFVTYRNIANNCPLVLWWGDSNYPPTHPLGVWYPLFPRRTNQQRDIVPKEQIFDDHPF